MKTPEQCVKYITKLTIKVNGTSSTCSGVFIDNFKHITYCPGVSIVDFEQVDPGWIKVPHDILFKS